MCRKYTKLDAEVAMHDIDSRCDLSPDRISMEYLVGLERGTTVWLSEIKRLQRMLIERIIAELDCLALKYDESSVVENIRRNMSIWAHDASYAQLAMKTLELIKMQANRRGDHRG